MSIAIICSPSRRDAARLVTGDSEKRKRFALPFIETRHAVSLLFAVLLTFIIMLARVEIEWNRIAHLSLAGKTKEVLPEYEKLYRWLGKNGLFLYNHAAELLEAGQFEKNLAVFARCTHYFNDFDVQMSIAENLKELGQYAQAEMYLKTASAMCPARFIPLYELTKLYDVTGRNDEALALAVKIIDKDVKISSQTVSAIKNEMRRFVETQKTSNNPEKESRTSGEPLNNQTRQGELPKVLPNGTALPP